MFKTKENLLVAIMNCLPYVDQIKDLDFLSEPEEIRFTWRSTKFVINTNAEVSIVDGNFISCNNEGILLSALFKRYYAFPI